MNIERALAMASQILKDALEHEILIQETEDFHIQKRIDRLKQIINYIENHRNKNVVLENIK